MLTCVYMYKILCSCVYVYMYIVHIYLFINFLCTQNGLSDVECVILVF